MSEVIIGVDLGGTRIRAGRLDKHLEILERVETLTLADEGLESTLGRIKAEIHKVLPQDKTQVLGIGVSAPGPLNPETGVIVRPPNLLGWEDVPLGDILHQEFGVPVYLGNDANLAALAEVARGVAYGYKHAIYLTVSTGIGSGIVIDGRLLLGREGLAAEAGHMVMMVGDRVSTLETEAAGPDMARLAVERIKTGEKSMMTEFVNDDLEAITGSVVGRAAQAGDPLAQELIQRTGFLVGLGIVNLLHLFNPEIVVVGGGVTHVGEMLFKPMREAIQKYAIDDAYWRDLRLESPALGDDVSLIGAAVLVATRGGQATIAQVLARLNAP
ncbi:MAG: ROK family protein [Chitinophagaceae bacterium]|nr:ROK family protein [Anaerolineae bacterium]